MAKGYKLSAAEWEDLKFAVETGNLHLATHFMVQIERRSIFNLIPRVNFMRNRREKVT